MRPEATGERRLALARTARRRFTPAAPLRPSRGTRLTVADVALFYGERSGGIRTYVDAKTRWARESRAIEHHVVVPGVRERHDDGWHELPSLRMAAANGYRLPVGVGALKGTLSAIRPDVVLLHDPFWSALGVVEHAHALGATVVAVHHGSSELDAAGLPGPDELWRPLLRAWLRRSCAEVDAIMAAVDTRRDTRRAADVRLRFGVHEAFRPRPEVPRGEHVLYVGRLAREKGVAELLEAAGRSAEPWPLHVVGSGPLVERLARRARRPDLAGRVRFLPYVRSRTSLACLYAGAACVVMPGAHETYGLVALEAAASGARVVTCETAPALADVAEAADTYAPGDVDGLLAAIERARARPGDRARAQALARRATWEGAFEAELADLSGIMAARTATA